MLIETLEKLAEEGHTLIGSGGVLGGLAGVGIGHGMERSAIKKLLDKGVSGAISKGDREVAAAEKAKADMLRKLKKQMGEGKNVVNSPLHKQVKVQNDIIKNVRSQANKRLATAEKAMPEIARKVAKRKLTLKGGLAGGASGLLLGALASQLTKD